jgi:carbonic anhydrase/acetyltransferase-like protein (isoleucine patch superfamily)
MIRDFNGHQPSIHSTAYVSDLAAVIGRVNLAAGVSVWPGSVLRADVDDILVGSGSNLQDGVLVHPNHGLPAVIGKEVTIGHGAVVHGCRIGDRCLIGMGAIILDGAVIEDDCIVGAGALVPENFRVPSGTLVLGVPAKPVRAVRPDEREHIEKSAQEYRELARQHQQQSGR